MKTNWKAWASVVVSTFAGAALAFFALPHDGKGAKELLIGAALAGLSAVAHLLQQPKLPSAPAAAEEEKPKSKTAGEIVEEKAAK